MNNITFKSIMSEVASSIYADVKDLANASGTTSKLAAEATAIQTADKVNMGAQWSVEKLNTLSNKIEEKSCDALVRMIARKALREGNKPAPAGPVAVPAASSSVKNADGSVSYVFGKKVA